MDPQASWDALLAAYRERDAQRTEEHARALHEWLLKGGVPPDTGGGPSLGDSWHRHLSYAAIAFTLEYVAATRDEKGGDA